MVLGSSGATHEAGNAMLARAIARLVKQRSSAQGRQRNADTRDCVVWGSSRAARKESDAKLARASAWLAKQGSCARMRARKATQR
mmetsp:Transcript_10591/g.22510  ORF Transcript_10591/g.22510 Transcript_10591/m.22510 type:complete len:85 (-) Transcript_10591:7-261(-)